MAYIGCSRFIQKIMLFRERRKVAHLVPPSGSKPTKTLPLSSFLSIFWSVLTFLIWDFEQSYLWSEVTVISGFFRGESSFTRAWKRMKRTRCRGVTVADWAKEYLAFAWGILEVWGLLFWTFKEYMWVESFNDRPLRAPSEPNPLTPLNPAEELYRQLLKTQRW